MAYTKYSLTPSSNTAAPPDGAPEGMLPSAVNDTMRDMMAQIRDCGDGIRDGTYTMTAPKITGGTITGATLTGNTFTSPVISGGSINNTPIGATTANTGAFTTLSATGVTTVQAGTNSAPAITTTGDTNTGMFFPAADTIAFTEGGAEAMRIDSSGRLGIGTTSPSTPLEIKSPQFTDSEITLDNTSSNTTSRVLFKAAGTEYGRVSGDSTQVTLQAGNIPMVFRTNSAERMRIDSSGNLLVGITSARSNAGDVQVSKGISFPATQSAQSDANTLDDYEEGTWTPTFNANLTAAAAYAKGRYVKIGSMVWVTYAFRVGTVSGGNDVEFGGLPFANIANTADTSSDTFLFTAYSGGPTVGDRGAGGYISSNSSTIIMYDLNNNANVTAMTNGDLTADDFIWVSGWYRTS